MSHQSTAFDDENFAIGETREAVVDRHPACLDARSTEITESRRWWALKDLARQARRPTHYIPHGSAGGKFIKTARPAAAH